jgi:hypothetical protein
VFWFPGLTRMLFLAGRCRLETFPCAGTDTKDHGAFVESAEWTNALLPFVHGLYRCRFWTLIRQFEQTYAKYMYSDSTLATLPRRVRVMDAG